MNNAVTAKCSRAAVCPLLPLAFPPAAQHHSWTLVLAHPHKKTAHTHTSTTHQSSPHHNKHSRVFSTRWCHLFHLSSSVQFTSQQARALAASMCNSPSWRAPPPPPPPT